MKKLLPISSLIFALMAISALCVAQENGENSGNAGDSDGASAGSENAVDTADSGQNGDSTESTDPAETVDVAVEEEKKLEGKNEHFSMFSPFKEDYTVKATLKTSLGDVECELFAGQHPMTVLNFMALAKGKPAWKDASGNVHDEPYYRQLSFSKRLKGKYVMVGERPEGTGFVVGDERCKSHAPVAGAIAMVQVHPGMAAAQFILLSSDMPVFKGLYTVFGQCSQPEVIKELTKSDAILDSITF